jgi:hypothetical protein
VLLDFCFVSYLRRHPPPRISQQLLNVTMEQALPFGGHEPTPPTTPTQPSTLTEDGAPVVNRLIRAHVSETCVAGKQKGKVTAACRPVTPPGPSESLSTNATTSRKSATTRRPTISRKSTASRKQRTFDKRTPHKYVKTVGKGGNETQRLSENLRLFLLKEARWSEEQAISDSLLKPPPPNHRYVDGNRRLLFNDLRFTAREPPKTSSKKSAKKEVEVKDPHYILSAGIPSAKSYAPCHEAALLPIQIPILGSHEDPGWHTITDNKSQEEAFHARPSVKLIIPDVLKALLVDDWENVTKNMQLVPLPHPKPVTKILEDYSAYEMPKRPAGSSHTDILEETLSGLREYFDKSLGRILLYK